jgi:hypothetical protein
MHSTWNLLALIALAPILAVTAAPAVRLAAREAAPELPKDFLQYVQIQPILPLPFTVTPPNRKGTADSELK